MGEQDLEKRLALELAQRDLERARRDLAIATANVSSARLRERDAGDCVAEAHNHFDRVKSGTGDA